MSGLSLRSGLRLTSLRRVISDAAPFSPTNITSLIGMYEMDADNLRQGSDGTGTVSANGDPVGYVADLSGQGNHLIQATTAAKPTYQSALAAANNRPYLSFDGVNQYIQRTLDSALTSSDLTVLVVVQTASPAQSAGSAVFSSAADGTLAKAFQIDLSGSSSWRVNTRNNAGTGGASATIGAADTNPALLMYRAKSTGADTAKNGTAGGTLADPTQATATVFRAGMNRGGTALFSGKILAVYVFSDDLGASDEQSMEDYIESRFGITVA